MNLTNQLCLKLDNVVIGKSITKCTIIYRAYIVGVVTEGGQWVMDLLG